MTDDLVRRLQAWAQECEEQHGPGMWSQDMRAASDRIEELTEALATLYWGVAEYGAPDEKLEQAHAALKGTKYE